MTIMFPGRSAMRIDWDLLKLLHASTQMTWREHREDIHRVTGVIMPDAEQMRRQTRKRSIFNDLTDEQLTAFALYHRVKVRQLLTARPEGPSRPSGYLYSLATRLATRYPEHEHTVLLSLFQALPDLMPKLLPEVDVTDFE